MHLRSEREIKKWRLKRVTFIPADHVLNKIEECSNREAFQRYQNGHNTAVTRNSGVVYQRTHLDIVAEMTWSNTKRNISITPILKPDDFNVKNGEILSSKSQDLIVSSTR